MSDKLNESAWTSFTKKQQLDLDDGALTKALARFDKTDEAKHEARLDALQDVADQIKKQIVVLAKRKKALGDKPFNLAKDKLDEFLDLAEDLQKKTRNAAADAAAQEAEEADTPALLTTKMVPLLRELRKGEAQMHALIGTAGRGTAVLIMRRPISTARRKLLAEALDASGGAKYIPADCLFENKVLTFVVKAPAAGLAKRLRQALLEQVDMRLKVKVRGDDGEEQDGEDAGDEQAGVQPQRPAPPTGQAQTQTQAPTPSAEQLLYQERLRKLKDPLAQALQSQHPETAKLRALMGFASEKADEKKDYVAALKALDALEKVLVPAEKPVQQASPDTPETADKPGTAEAAETKPAAKKPIPAGAYAAMKQRALPRLDMAKTRNPFLAHKITEGVSAADALSAGNDDAAAIASLRAFIREVEDTLAVEREKLEERLAALYDKATKIRLELKSDMDPFTVQTTVSKLLEGWNFDTAKVTLDNFEKAIEKAKPLDFEDLSVVQERRAKQFRKENAKFARNTEQALLAAKRVIDDDGNLLLGDALLDDPAYAKPVAGSKEEGLKQRALTQKLLRDLPFIRVDDLASVSAEIAGTKDAGLPQSVHALRMLQRLQTDKGVQAALGKVTAPPDPSTATTEEGKQSLRTAQTLIRNSLGLADDAPITDAEAKRAAVAALLSQVRQVDIGSCFATASAVRAQRNNPEQFLADIGEMLSSGKLTREKVESPPGTKVKIQVPISREMLGRKVDVTRKNTNLHLKPGMVAGLDAMGIGEGDHKAVIEAAARRLRAERALAKALAKVASFLPGPHTVDTLTQTALKDLDANPAKTIEVALNSALAALKLSTASDTRSRARKKVAADCCKDFDDVDGADDFTPQQLLEQIAKSRPEGALPADRVAAAKAAYDTSQDNTLSRAWEYTVASMAEQHPDIPSKAVKMAQGLGNAVGNSADKLAEDSITKDGLTGGAATDERNFAAWVKLLLTQGMEKELKTRYDPGVGGRSEALSTDGNSSSGGYSLFFRGEKIDGQAGFEAALKTLLDEAKQELGAKNWTADQIKRAQALADQMKDQVETKAFRDGAVDALAKGAVDVADTHPDYAKKYADQKDRFNKPWTRKEGGYEGAIMQLYENRPNALVQLTTEAYTYKVGGVDKSVSDAEGVTHFVMDKLMQAKVADRMPDDASAEDAIVPVGNNYHSFSITPGSPELMLALKQGKKPETVVKELKEFEGAKNEKRRAVEVPLTDLSTGFAADGIAQAATIFASTQWGKVIPAIKAHFQALGKESLPLDQFKAELKKAVRHVLDTSYPNVAEGARDGHATTAANESVSAAKLLDRVVPKEEYEPLIDAGMRKLSVPEESREAIKKAVLAAVKQDSVVREDFAKAIRTEMRKQGLGGGEQDLKLAREAYDALKTDDERIAALKAAGKTVTAPAAKFDALKDEESAALREHGVATRLDAKLDKALVEPRGLVFADTNWGDGDHMTNFSMVVNPLTDPPVLEMWQMNEDGSDARPVGKDWIKDNKWRIFADPKEYGGVLDGHEVTTTTGKKQWEVFRADLRAKLADCQSANKGDLGKLQRILEVADARFAEADFAAADKAINKLAEELAPVEQLAGVLAKGVRPLESVSAEVKKQIDELKKDAKEKKLKALTPAQKEANAAYEVLGGLIFKLRYGIKTPQDLATFVAENKDVLDYIDAQSPIGALNVVTSLTTA